MKKIAFLAAVALLALSAGAQKHQQATIDAELRNPSRWPIDNAGVPMSGTGTKSLRNYAKSTTATIIASDTFNSASLTTGGWKTGTGTQAWNVRTTYSTYLQAIFSTTASTGFLNYDAGGIAIANANVQPQIGYVFSPAYDCSGRNYVGVYFQQYTQKFADTFYVDVSTDSFLSYTRFPVFPNNGLANNEETHNPEVTRINITSAAANRPNVRVRFYYIGGYTGTGRNGSGGTYGWNIDDFRLLSIDSVDVALATSGVVMTLGGGKGITPAGTMVKSFIDTNGFYPVTMVRNYGGVARGNSSNVTVTAQVSGTSGTPTNNSVVFNDFPINAYDSLADFTQYAGFKTTTTGSYVATFNATTANDGTQTNNVDTAVFSISDSSLAVFRGYDEAGKRLPRKYAIGGIYIHNADATSSYNYWRGCQFEVPQGSKKDTVSSVNICFHQATTSTAIVQAELYKLSYATPRRFVYKGRTVQRTLDPSEISTSYDDLKFATLRMATGKPANYTIIDSGTWAVVVRQINTSTAGASSVIITAMPGAPATIVGDYGTSDTASAGQSYGQDLTTASRTADFGEEVNAAMVNFGDASNLPSGVGVAGLSNVSIGNAYPNPANTTLNVPVSAIGSETVSISLSNMIGQTLQTQRLGTITTGNAKIATFNTTQLAPGMYFYTVEAGGERETRRVVIAH